MPEATRVVLGFAVAKASYDVWDGAIAVYNTNAPQAVAAQCNLLGEIGHTKVMETLTAKLRIDERQQVFKDRLGNHGGRPRALALATDQ